MIIFENNKRGIIMNEFVLNRLGAKDAIRHMMIGSKYETYKDIAEKLGIPQTTLRNSLNNNSLRVRDLINIADLLGYEIKIQQKERES